MDSFNKILFKFYRIYLKKTGVYNKFDSFIESEMDNEYRYTKLKGLVRLGYKPNLKNPLTFNEKSIHRRLFDRSELWPIVTHKITVRDWLVEKKLNKDAKLMPMLDVIENVKDYDFSQIKEPVVIKAAWASGMNIFVKNPQLENWELIRDKMLSWKKTEYAPERLVWAATQMDRNFIVEKMYSTPSSDLLEDYKFYVFHGKVELIQIIIGRDDQPCYAHFDRSLNRLELSRFNKKEIDDSYQLSSIVSTMILAAEKIGQYFDFARIDLYELDGDVYFGEITQSPNNGFARFEPNEFDIRLGGKWNYTS